MILKNKIIVVTGGAGLLGAHFCSAIAAQGGTAIIADLDIIRAEAVAKKIKDSGGKAEAVLLDISDTISVNNLIEYINDSYGEIHAVVNNAYPRNKNYGRKLEDVTYMDFCENVSEHLGGYFLIAQKFSLYFRKNRGGNIINMASIYGVVAPKFEIYNGTSMTMAVEYAAIKSAIIHITRYFSQYFKLDDIRCNSISPGGVFDNQPEDFLKKYKNNCSLKGMLEPQDITGALVFLLSDASKYINGQNLIVDDGFTL